jgi:DNA repair protein RadA
LNDINPYKVKGVFCCMVVKKDIDEVKEAVSGDIEVEKPATRNSVPSKLGTGAPSSSGKKKAVKEEKEPKLIDLPGVGPGAVAKLEAAGIYELMGLAVLTPAQLSETAGMSESVARKAIQASRKMMDMGFVDGLAHEEKRKELFHITTGSKNVDNLLGGKGLQTKAITEAFGAFGSGKTQLALSLAVGVQLPVDQGGANGKAVYIDTEGTFRPERVRQFAEGIGANADKVLKNILVARAFNSDHQMLLLDRVADLIKDGEPIRLMIIDSLTAHFRAEFSGRGMLADRQQRLNRYLHNLMRVAEQNNLAVYVTNQVMSDPAQMFGDPTKAIGGNIVGHACTYRMYLRRGKKDSRVCKLIDSPDLPDNETVFMIESDGLRDIDI